MSSSDTFRLDFQIKLRPVSSSSSSSSSKFQAAAAAFVKSPKCEALFENGDFTVVLCSSIWDDSEPYYTSSRDLCFYGACADRSSLMYRLRLGNLDGVMQKCLDVVFGDTMAFVWQGTFTLNPEEEEPLPEGSIRLFPVRPAAGQVQPTMEEEQKKPMDLSCVICLERPRDRILLPCNHFVLCQICSSQIQGVCPVCNAKARVEPVFM
jgi:hypothetical protein